MTEQTPQSTKKRKRYAGLCGAGWVVLLLSCASFLAPPSEVVFSDSITMAAFLVGSNIFNLIALGLAIPHYRSTKGAFSGLLILSTTIVIVLNSVRILN